MTSSSYVIRDVAMQWHPVTNIGSTSGGGKLTDPALVECERAGFGPVLSSPATVKKSATENSELNKKQSYKHVGRYSGSFSPPGRVWGYFTSRMEDLEKKKIQNQYFITWLATLKIFHQFPHTLVLHELWPLSYDQENKRFASFL